MAAISGVFTSDGESAVLSGTSGNLDLGVKHAAASTGSVSVLISYDGGTLWFSLEGGSLGSQGGDRMIQAGSSDVQYKLKAVGVTGSVHYFLGAS